MDLGLTKRPSAEFHALGSELINECRKHAPVRPFGGFQFTHCWGPMFFGYDCPAANVRAPDRFASPKEHLRSNLIQHSPLQWLEIAAQEDPEPDVFVWLGYSILKQGDFTNQRLKTAHIGPFLDKVARYEGGDIPIPSIRPEDPIQPYGDNWQFVGSTIIAPRRFLPHMVHRYRAELFNFVSEYQAIPLDLAIWPAVVRNSGLPFSRYPADYDATQLTNFPG